MAVLLIPAIFLGAIALGLFVLAMIGMALTIALKVLIAFLWVAIKIVERRGKPLKSGLQEIEIVIEDDDELPMRDVTPRRKAIAGPRSR